MSDPNDAFHRTPLSSSSTNTSGTQALSIVIEAETAEQVADESQAADALPVDAAANENLVTGGDAATELPSEAPAYQAPSAEPETMEPITQTSLPDLPAQPCGSDEPAISEIADNAYEAAPDTVSEPSPPESELVPEQQAYPAEESVEAAPSAPPAIDDVDEAVHETIVHNEGKQERVLDMFEKVTGGFKSVMEDARSDAARLTFKLMEFAQANLRNNIEFARDYASVRSVPEIFNVQTAYIKRQMDLVNQQTEELQKLTSEIASRKASQLQFQGRRT